MPVRFSVKCELNRITNPLLFLTSNQVLVHFSYWQWGFLGNGLFEKKASKMCSKNSEFEVKFTQDLKTIVK